MLGCVLGGYQSAQVALQVGAFTQCWQRSDKLNLFHLTIMRNQNIKMSISELDKNARVMPFLCFLVHIHEK